MKSGHELIAAERQEHQSKHGYDLDHDLYVNSENELPRAATIIIDAEHNDIDDWRRLEWNEKMYLKIINKSRVEQLAIAGSLIAAEIDRLQALTTTPH